MQLSEENKREIKFHDELQSKDKARFENRFYKSFGEHVFLISTVR